MNKRLAYTIATYFGLGCSKYAPGTMGSLGTLPLAYLLLNFSNLKIFAAVIVFLFILGVKATEIVIADSGDSDPSKVVIDETVGQLLSFSLVACAAPEFLQGAGSIIFYLAGFALFRFFDILKMGPVKYADTKIKNAYGVMLDDVFAGIFAAVLLLAALYGLIALQQFPSSNSV